MNFNLLKSSFGILLGNFFNKFFRFLSGMIVARILGPSQYGVFNLARNIVLILDMFTRMGLELGMVKLIHQSKKEEIRYVILQSIFFVLFISLSFILLINHGGAQFLSKYFKYEHFKMSLEILIFSLPFVSLMAVLRGIFKGYLYFSPIIFSESFFQPILRLLLIIFLFFLFGWRLKGVLYATVLSFLAASLYLLIIYFKKFFSTKFLKICFKNLFNFENFWKIYRFSFITFLTGSVIFLLQRMDLLMIGYFLPSEEVGKYSVIQLIIPLIGLIGISLNQIIAPLIANAWNNFDVIKVKYIMFQHIKWTFLTSLPILLIFVFYGNKLLLIFGSKYKVDSAVIIVLAFTYFLMYSFFSTGFALSMTDKHVTELFCMSFALIFNFFLNLLLIPVYGLLGAAIATFTGIIVSLILKMLAIYKYYKIHIFNKELLWLFLVCSFMFLIGTIIKTQVIIFFGLIIVAYIIILFLSPFKRDILFLINLMKKQFLKK